VAHYDIRDLIGHFVALRSARGKMCPHACCRNKRVHPANMPVILPSKLLWRASDDDLIALYDRVQSRSAKDERARAQVLHEMERRDRVAEERKAAPRSCRLWRLLPAPGAPGVGARHAYVTAEQHSQEHRSGLRNE
jgi:hypothetical protein